MFPVKEDRTCACGCGSKLKGKQKKWASDYCSTKAYEIFAVIKGNNSQIRKQLFEIDGGFCRSCGVYDENWEADHVIPVHQGGGLCGIENFQTLCTDCHAEKSKIQILSHRNAISSQAASIPNNVLLYAPGETL